MSGRHRPVLLLALVMAVAPFTAPAIGGNPESDGGSMVSAALPAGLRAESVSRSDPWVTISPCPHAVTRAAGAVLDGHFFVIGGEPWDGYVQEYDPATTNWDAANAIMPSPASNLCAAVIGGSIYIPGGWTGSVNLDALQVYAPTSDTWQTIATDPVPVPLSGSACAAYNNKLYVFGGSASGTFVDTTYVFDPAATAGNRWTTGAAAPTAGAYGDAIAAGGFIYYAGMRDATTDLAGVYRYDPAADSWTVVPSLTTPRGGARLWTYEGKLAVGGGGWSSYLASVEEYDLNTGTGGTWTAGNPLNVGRRTFAAAQDLRDGSLYAAGGWNGAYLGHAEQNSFMLAVTFYFSYDDFNAAVPGLPVEDFEEGDVAPYEVRVCSDPYDSTTDDDCWDPNDILPGIRFGSSLGGGMVILGPGYLGSTIKTSANSFPQFIRLDFPRGVFAVGFHGHTNGPLFEPIDIRIFGQGSQIGAVRGFMNIPPIFWGAVSTELITRVEIESFNLTGEVIDNVAFGGGGVLFEDDFESGNAGAWSTWQP